ncbi:MAG TPA: sigma 54-interacting transcriptional regulator [Vicinamibacterales bacterium]|nr:sigma 54-interacting transcriptional regulator [Vicinamibacterales bacterium]
MNRPLVIVGHSAAMRRISQEIAVAALSDVPVLISGEPGVGRRLIARTIHDRSMRYAGPFMSINCALLPDSRLESELFGQVKGSGADSRSDVRGRLDAANHGTVLLQDVAYLSRRLQGRVLRFTETKQIQKVGALHLQPSDVRLMAISRRRLVDSVSNSTFREDLFYRVNVIHIEVPALRQRREDVPALFKYFQSVHAARLGRPLVDLTPDALHCLIDYDWPDNVRELKNVAEHLAVSCESERAGVEDLPTEIARGFSPRSVLRAVPAWAPSYDRVRGPGRHSAGA